MNSDRRPGYGMGAEERMKRQGRTRRDRKKASALHKQVGASIAASLARGCKRNVARQLH